MKRTAAALLLMTTVASTAGCTTAVRYSHDEIKDYPPEMQEHIKKGEVTVGMTKVQARYAWGGPHDVRVLPPSEQGKERVEWSYKRYGVFKTRLIFTDNILTDIITSEPGVAKDR
ncbi:MAG: lipoprotein [Thermodesulfovibrionales bacterium]